MSQRNERSRPDFSSVTHWLIRQAAHRAPKNLASRLEEEWLADLESRAATLSQLRLALGCCWAGLVIGNEYPRSRVAAASPAVAASGFVTLVDRNFGYFSLRSATLFLIAGLHAALFFGLITSLSHTQAAVTPPDLQNHEVTPVPPEKVPVSPPWSELKNWTIHVPRTVIEPPATLDFEHVVNLDTSDQAPEVIAQPSAPETPTHVVRQLAGGPGTGFPETADFYASRLRALSRVNRGRSAGEFLLSIRSSVSAEEMNSGPKDPDEKPGGDEAQDQPKSAERNPRFGNILIGGVRRDNRRQE